ncbi:NAD(P)-dependent oxidoreductase [Micromonospora sp. KC723]|uniref:NAD-dependent epimerase/dehydratase family protein n=1 Tax=Micromonospora sp. KC723 TaxID=2530381 RepID=UPI0014043F14|nr:NAD(P)-dependent oxidoreductase [Micromonospora sp. KC723]
MTGGYSAGGGAILLTGATGFVGGAVLAALRARRPAALRVLLRGGFGPGSSAGATVVHGDLSKPQSLSGVCDGVDTLIHAASYVGKDQELCTAVNDQGTRHLVREATAAGVRRLVYVSTAAVYGSGPHRGPREGELPIAPRSPVSASRAAAEVWVREAGGCVLRPHLVYGPGDRWFVPALAALLAALPGWVDGGNARASMISVTDLARLTVAAATRLSVPPGTALHANHPRPVRMRDAGAALARGLGVAVPRGSASRAQVQAHFRRAGLPERQLELLTIDHWYDSTAIWQLTGCMPGPSFLEDMTHAGHWYACGMADGSISTGAGPSTGSRQFTEG